MPLNASIVFADDLDAGRTAGLFRSLETPSKLAAFALGDGDRIFKASDAFLELVVRHRAAAVARGFAGDQTATRSVSKAGI